MQVADPCSQWVAILATFRLNCPGWCDLFFHNLESLGIIIFFVDSETWVGYSYQRYGAHNVFQNIYSTINMGTIIHVTRSPRETVCDSKFEARLFSGDTFRHSSGFTDEIDHQLKYHHRSREMPYSIQCAIINNASVLRTRLHHYKNKKRGKGTKRITMKDNRSMTNLTSTGD